MKKPCQNAKKSAFALLRGMQIFSFFSLIKFAKKVKNKILHFGYKTYFSVII